MGSRGGFAVMVIVRPGRDWAILSLPSQRTRVVSPEWWGECWSGQRARGGFSMGVQDEWTLIDDSCCLGFCATLQS